MTITEINAVYKKKFKYDLTQEEAQKILEFITDVYKYVDEQIKAEG